MVTLPSHSLLRRLQITLGKFNACVLGYGAQLYAQRSVTWKSQSSVSPTTGHPIDPFGRGKLLFLSLVMDHLSVHSCCDMATSSTTDRRDAIAVAKKDRFPSSNRFILVIPTRQNWNSEYYPCFWGDGTVGSWLKISHVDLTMPADIIHCKMVITVKKQQRTFLVKPCIT